MLQRIDVNVIQIKVIMVRQVLVNNAYIIKDLIKGKLDVNVIFHKVNNTIINIFKF